MAPLKLSADYKGPPPLPQELADRFAYKPEKVEPKRPTIHVPEAEAPSSNGEEPAAAPTRKRTRRGSRGGRRHRKPAASTTAEQPSDES